MRCLRPYMGYGLLRERESCASDTYFKAVQTKALNMESSLLLRGMCELSTSSTALRRVYSEKQTELVFVQ